MADEKKIDEGKRVAEGAKKGPLEVDWQLRKPSWSEQNRFLLENAVWTDCVFVVGAYPENTKRFACHKLLLGKTSPVFGAMLFGDLADPEDIQVTDIEPQTFRAMLDFIYTGLVNFGSCGDLSELCIAADKYMLVPLKQRCLQYLEDVLSPALACQAFELARMMDCKHLEHKAWKVIKKRTNEVISSASFIDAQNATLLEIVQQKKLHITSEAELISAIFRWAESEVERQGLSNNTASLRGVLGPVFQHLRFLSLTHIEFANGAARSSILTDQEKVAISIDISSNEAFQSIAVLDKFCNIKDGRVASVHKIPNFVFQELSNKSRSCTNCGRQVNASQIAAGISCYLMIECDKNVFVLGFNISSESNMSGVPCIAVKDHKGNYLNTGQVTITNTNEAYLKFEKPILIQANQKYCLMIASETGTVVASLGTDAPVNNTGVNLFTEEITAVVAKPGGVTGFIQSLVYKCA